MRAENAAQDAYDRLMATRRIVTPTEQEEADRESVRQNIQARIRRRLPKVY